MKNMNDDDSFMVRDSKGNIWPPRFKSRLTDRKDELCVMANPKAAASRENLKVGFKASQHARGGWGNGTIPGMNVPKHIVLRPVVIRELTKKERKPRDPNNLQQLVLKCLKTHGKMVSSEIAEKLNLDSRTVNKRLANLKLWGYVEPIGDGRGRYWKAIR